MGSKEIIRWSQDVSALLEKRYYHYLLFLNLTVNLIVFVPRILLAERFTSGLMSIFCSIPIGFLLLYTGTKLIRQFPGQGLPEILTLYAHPILRAFSYFVMMINWYVAGLVALLSYVEISQRFIDPKLSQWVIIFIYLALVLYCIPMNSKSLLYGLEIALVTNAPFILIFIIKTFTAHETNWTGAKEIATHALHFPSFQGIAAATFLFSGYTNLVIFNRHISPRFSMKEIIYFPLAALSFIIYCYFVPIAFHGTIAVGEYTYPWILTADSVRFEWFFVERVIFLFLMIYLVISIDSIIVHWHICLEIMKHAFGVNKNKSYRRLKIGAFMGVLTGMALYIEKRLDEKDVFDLVLWFFEVRFLSEFLLIVVLYYLSRRKKKCKKAKPSSSCS